MDDNTRRGEPAASDRLHPNVYIAIVCLALLFAIASWGFAGGGYIDVALVVMSGLVLVAVAIPFAIYLVGRTEAGDDERAGPFRDWLAGDFETWQERMKSSRAMVEILLPVAAVAFGMALFAIVLHLVPHTAA